MNFYNAIKHAFFSHPSACFSTSISCFFSKKNQSSNKATNNSAKNYRDEQGDKHKIVSVSTSAGKKSDEKEKGQKKGKHCFKSIWLVS